MIEVLIVENRYQTVEQVIRAENVFVPRVGEYITLDSLDCGIMCVTRVVVEYTQEAQLVRVYVE